MADEQSKFQQLLDMNSEIEQVKDVDVLLEKILTVARQVVNADAGSIYTVQQTHEQEQLKFNNAQNETLRKKLGAGKKLVYKTYSMPINHASIAGYVASTGETLNIPDVYEIPAEVVPYRFQSAYDKETNYRCQSMLTIPLTNIQNKVIGVMQLINAYNVAGNVTPFSETDIPLIRIFANKAAMEIERAQNLRTLILRMISMAELRDPKETGPHVNRVGAYASEIYETWAHKKRFDQKKVDTEKDILRMAAMLHDVGKVGIADQILRAERKLTEDEYNTMKKHTLWGARLFIDPQSPLDEIAGEIALNHHERWDGTGYPGHVQLDGHALAGHADTFGNPQGKKGEEIPIFARIVSVADVFDALSSKRVYKEAWSENLVLEEFTRSAGTFFDPEVVEAFFSSLESIRAVAQRFPDENHVSPEGGKTYGL